MQEKVISLNALKDLKKKVVEKLNEAIEFAKYKDTRRFEFEKWFEPRLELFNDCDEVNSLMRKYIHHANSRY